MIKTSKKELSPEEKKAKRFSRVLLGECIACEAGVISGAVFNVPAVLTGSMIIGIVVMLFSTIIAIAKVNQVSEEVEEE